MKKVIGIDLGTTNSVVAFKTKNVDVIRNRENEELTRSCVGLIDKQFVVGRIPFKYLLSNEPHNLILSIKRLMGMTINDKEVQTMIDITKNPFGYYKYNITELQGGDGAVAVALSGKQYTSEQISAEILKKLKADTEEKLGDQITHAVITVPAYFTEKQKNATRIAANLAGLKVSRLLAEPTAAAISYGVDNLKPGEAKTVLVYDFGGGTCDLSVLNIVDGQYLEMGTGGDRWLGGDDLDQALQEYVYRRLEKEYRLQNIKELIQRFPKKYRFLAEMREKTEEDKIQLSSLPSAHLSIDSLLQDENGDYIDIDITITRPEFEELIRSYIQRTIDLIDELLKKIGYDIGMIDHILLVGGSSCIPLVKRMLAQKYGESKILMSNKPMLAIAEGAAILAHRLQDEYECPNCGKIVQQNDKICKNCEFDLESEIRQKGVDEVVFTTKHNYFIELKDKVGNLYKDPIIDEQTPLPCSIHKVYKTTVNNQQIIQVNLYSGKEHGEICEVPEAIGFTTLDVDLPVDSDIIVEIEIDADETFQLYFYPKGQTHRRKKVILGRAGTAQKTFKTISGYLDNVETGDFTIKQKESFYKFAKKQISEAEKLNPEDPNDNEPFCKIYCEIGEYYDNLRNIEETVIQVDEKESILMQATILCQDYPNLLGMTTTAKMEKLIAEVRGDSDPFTISQSLEQLKELVDEHKDILAIAILRIAANKASELNPEDANRLLKMHDSIVNNFQIGKRKEGYEELNKALEIAHGYLSKEQKEKAIGLGKYLQEKKG